MRVAALYDVHGNLPALEAALADVERADADVVLVGGDVVSGPFPLETLERLRALGDRALFVRGNGDRDAGSDDWLAGRLGEDAVRFLADLPLTASLDVTELGGVLFCHGSPRSEDEILTRVTTEEHLEPALAGVAEEVVVCGHTHVQYDRRGAGRRIVNAGSVGMAYEGAPGAHWALLGPGVELRRSEYDVQEATERILATGFPEARDFVEIVTEPVSAQEATEHFERMAREQDA